MTRPRCEETGKAAWPTREAAETSPQPSPEAWAYLCPAGCNQWHITSRRRRGYAPDRRRARRRPKHPNTAPNPSD